jgi:hypothetical protein
MVGYRVVSRSVKAAWTDNTHIDSIRDVRKFFTVPIRHHRHTFHHHLELLCQSVENIRGSFPFLSVHSPSPIIIAFIHKTSTCNPRFSH